MAEITPTLEKCMGNIFLSPPRKIGENTFVSLSLTHTLYQRLNSVCLCDTKYHLLGLYKDYKIFQMS